MMENKEIKAIIEKESAHVIIIVILMIVFGVNFLCVALEEYVGLNSNFYGPLLTLLVLVFFAQILNKKGKQTEVLSARFEKDKVVFQTSKKKYEIAYENIKTVQMKMIINRYQIKKGYYKITIKVKGRNYTIFSGEDAEKQLDFVQTEISNIYKEFKRRGIKCS